MARPTENGLQYFPLDVDFDLDDKFQIISSKYGNDGLITVIILFAKIFDNAGYFYNWTEKEQILVSKRVNVDINVVLSIVNDCINYEIFNETKYKKYYILTSNGIQKRYFEATKRRKEVHIIKEFLINVDINSLSNIVIDNINGQSKVKRKIKEKESKDINISFENFWNLYDKKAEREICEKKWNKLTDEERTLTMDYLPKYKLSTPDKQYRKNPQTFLNKKSWNDEIIKCEKAISTISLEQTAENLITQYGERFYKVRNNFKSPVEDEFNINTSNYYDMKFSLSNKLPNENNYKDSPELLSLLEKKLRKKFLELNK